MPKPAHKKTTSSDWTAKLDPEEVEAAMEEATVDAYDEDEQHSGLLTVIQDELQFPFSAKVLGETVTIVDMEWPDNDGFGLDLIVERNGQGHCMEAQSVELLKPLPGGFAAGSASRTNGSNAIMPRTTPLPNTAESFARRRHSPTANRWLLPRSLSP